MEIQNWQIEVNSDEIYDFIINNDIFSGTNLLNTEQYTLNLLEKYIYDISMFHFNRLNIEYDSKSHYIEFWCKDIVDLNKFHFDCDEYEKRINNNYIYPFLSNIVYLNDSIYPTVITNIDLEKYKYKEFENEKNITLVFPKKNKHITFDGSKRHGVTTIFSEKYNNEPRYVIAINLWNVKPTNVEYYEKQESNKTFNIQTQIINIKPCNEDVNTIIVEDMLKYDFFENLFYKKKNKCEIFSDLISKDFYENNKYIFRVEEKKENQIKITNEEKVFIDFENIKTIDNVVSNNRFLQRFILNNIYSRDTCNWIINESELYAKENGGWTTNRHNNYPTTDIPIDNIKSIFTYVLGTIPTIINKIYKSYCIPENIPINIVDLFIVKYEKDAQNKLEIHTDGSFITFSIMLSSSKDYEGGGTEFIDGIKMFLEQGDVLVHSGYVKHSGLEVTNGVRYILVGFTSINTNQII